MRSLLRQALGLGLLVSPASADILHVDADLTTGANDGSSWADAFQGPLGIQDALSVAVAGDQLYVRQGDYVPGNVGQRARSIRLVTDVQIYGGFLGGESSPGERPAGGRSTISGDLAGDDGSGVTSDNSYHVVRASGTSPTAVLDGFVLTAGNSNGSNNNDRGGGALCINGANATFVRCDFIGNRCTFGGGAGYINGSSPLWFECTFQDNIGGSFGGAFDIASSGPVVFDRCSFTGNTASRAGALEIFATGGVSVTNCFFSDNVATGSGGGGAIWCGSGSNPVVAGCTVVNNASNSQNVGGFRMESPGVVVNSIFWNNTGPGGATGPNNQINGGQDVTYSIVQGGYSGAGNLNADPQLGAGFVLGASSPAIDAGSNAGVPPGIGLDIAGGARFVDAPGVPDTGQGTAPVVDMGAFELQGELGSVFCSGDGSGTACPCSNPGSAGEGCANSGGSGGVLAASGSASVGSDDLLLSGSQLAAGQPALCFTGTSTVSGGAGAIFGDGLRCVGGQVVRLGIVAANGAGEAQWGPGLGGLAGWSAGDTRYFQVWYRDPAGPCGGAFNLSSGLEVMLEP